MKRVKLLVLFISLLTMGVYSQSFGQNRRAEKKYSERVFHQPKSAKTNFKNKKAIKGNAKSTKQTKHFGKQKSKNVHARAYARRKD